MTGDCRTPKTRVFGLSACPSSSSRWSSSPRRPATKPASPSETRRPLWKAAAYATRLVAGGQVPICANIGYLLGTSEPDVQMALSVLLRPNVVFYDVGARSGFTAVLGARLVGSLGMVVCFEPLEANVRQLLHNASLNQFSQVVACCEAVSDRQGPVRFAVSEIPTLGRLTDAADGRAPDLASRMG